MPATKRDKLQHLPPRDLAPEQLNAIDLLAAGQTDAAVAAAVGVHRATVARWRTSPRFIAALNRQRQALFSAASDKLRTILPKALAAIGEALDGDDPELKLRAAFELLKQSKFSAGSFIGPTDPRPIVVEELLKRQSHSGSQYDDLEADLEGRPTATQAFALTWLDMEAAAHKPELTPAPPASPAIQGVNPSMLKS